MTEITISCPQEKKPVMLHLSIVQEVSEVKNSCTKSVQEISGEKSLVQELYRRIH